MGRVTDATRVLFGKQPEVVSGEIGTETEIAFAPFAVDRDDAPELHGQLRYRIFDHMWIGDPVVRSLKLLIPQPIIAAKWSAKPVSGDEVDKVVAAACEDLLGLGQRDGLMTNTWQANLEQSFECLTYGSMTAELVWGEPQSWTPEGGGRATVIRPIERLAPRWPHSIDPHLGYGRPDVGSKDPIAYVIQLGAKDRIPGSKLLHHVINPSAARYTGSSLLRPAYFFWKIKHSALTTWAIAYDRLGMGIPLVRHPTTKGAKEIAREIARKLRSHEEAYVTLPSTMDAQGYAWIVEILNAASSIADPLDVIKYMDHQIADAGLAGWMRLGTTEVGSKGVSETLSEPFYLAEAAIADRLAEDYTDQILARFVAVNFGSDVQVPRLRCTEIREDHVAVVVANIEGLYHSGIDMSDLETVNWARSTIGAPMLTTVKPVEGSAPAFIPGAPAGTGAITHPFPQQTTE